MTTAIPPGSTKNLENSTTAKRANAPTIAACLLSAFTAAVMIAQSDPNTVRLSTVVSAGFTNSNVLLTLQPVTSLVQRLFTLDVTLLLTQLLSVFALFILTHRQPLLFRIALTILGTAALFNTVSLPASGLAGVLCLSSAAILNRKGWKLSPSLAGMLAALAYFARPTAGVFAIVLLISAIRRESFTRLITGFLLTAITIVIVLVAIYGDFWQDLLLLKVPPIEFPDLIILFPVALLLIDLSPDRRLDQNQMIRMLGGITILVVATTVANVTTSGEPAYSSVHPRLEQIPVPLPCRVAFTRIDDAALLREVLNRAAETDCTPTVTALDGQLQRDIRRLVEQNNPASALIAALPEVIFDTGGFSASVIESSGLGYSKQSTVDGLTIWMRDPVQIGTARVLMPDAAFGPDLRLVTATIEAIGSSGVRVRLDWSIRRPATEPITIVLSSGDQTVTGTYSAAAFRQGDTFVYLYLSNVMPNVNADAPITVTAKVNNGTLSSIVLGS